MSLKIKSFPRYGKLLVTEDGTEIWIVGTLFEKIEKSKIDEFITKVITSAKVGIREPVGVEILKKGTNF